jgi:hypothetical protein
MPNVVLTDPNIGRFDALVASYAAMAALLMAVAVTIGWPVAPLSTLIIVAAAAVVVDRSVRAYEWRRRERIEMVRPHWFRLRPDQIPVDEVQDGHEMVYLGEGADWRSDTCQEYHDLIAGRTLRSDDYKDELMSLGLWPAQVKQGQDPAAMALTAAKKEGGDPRMLGLVWKRSRSIFIRKDLYAQHASIFGTTGSGKTRCIEGVLAYCAAKGHGTLVIDPKPDVGLTDLAWGLSQMHGRAFTWVSLANPEQSHKYNPVLGFGEDPTVLVTRIAAIIPDSPSQPFWAETPGRAAGATLIVQGWLWLLLRDLGSDGQLLARLHLAVGIAAKNAKERNASVVTVDDMRVAMAEAADGFEPVAEHDPMYRITRDGVAPNLRDLYRYTVDEPRSLGGLVGKILFPHLFVGVDGSQLALYETRRNANRQKDTPAFAVDLDLLMSTRLPIEDGYDRAAFGALPSVEAPISFAPEAIETLWAAHADRRDRIVRAIGQIRESMTGNVLPWSRNDFDRRSNYCSSLATALGGFTGRWDIVASPVSHLDVERVARNGEIAFVALNVLSLQATANSFAKVLLADLAAYAGAINASGNPKDAKELWVIVDEAASVLNDSVVRLLAQARSAKVRVVLMSQNRSGIESALSDPGKAKDALGNLTVGIQLRAGLGGESEEATKAYPQIQIRRTSHSTGASPAMGESGHGQVSIYSGNIGRNMQIHDTALVPSTMLQDLPQGCAIVNIDRVPHLVQYPAVVFSKEDAERYSWYRQIDAPLPAKYVEQLERDGLPIPEFHIRAVAREAAKAANQPKEN